LQVKKQQQSRQLSANFSQQQQLQQRARRTNMFGNGMGGVMGFNTSNKNGGRGTLSQKVGSMRRSGGGGSASSSSSSSSSSSNDLMEDDIDGF